MANDARAQALPKEAARLAAKIRENLPELRERYGIETLALFGSYVRGEEHANSDLDILVEFTRTPSLFEFIGLEDELGNLLHVKVDLVMRSALRDPVKRYIIDEAVPVRAHAGSTGDIYAIFEKQSMQHSSSCRE